MPSLALLVGVSLSDKAFMIVLINQAPQVDKMQDLNIR